MANIIRVEKYIKSDVGNNNNKFWYITLFDNGDVLTEWGRVGDKGQSKSFPSAGVGFLEKKCREKESYRNGEIPYRKLNVVESNSTVTVSKQSASQVGLKELVKKQIVFNNPIVAGLLEKLAKANAHQIMNATAGKITYNDTTGLFSTPLGIITQGNIDEANNLLVGISDMIVKGNYGAKLAEATNSFMMLVPQDIGHKRLEVKDFWRDQSKVQYQKQILDNLQASLSTTISSPKTSSTTSDVKEEKVFDCQLYLVEDGAKMDQLRKFYRSTRKDAHVCSHLDVKRAYEVTINTVRSSFEKRGAKMTNILDLWHGTRTCNLLSILKSGLMLPNQVSAQITGAMFGPGVYGAPASTKSLNYAYGYWSKGGYDDNCFMFTMKMAMGKYYTPDNPFSGHPPRGYDSCWAKANKSGVANDECIVYSTDQVDLWYLLEFTPGGK